MVNKKAQFTLYIIFGIIILFIFAFIFHVYFKYIRIPRLPETDTTAFRNYMELCMKQRTEFSLFKLGYAGGDLRYTKKFKNQRTETGYALYEGNKYILPLEEVEKQIEGDIISGVPECVERFSKEFLKKHNYNNYNITVGQTKIDVLIAYKDIVVTGEPNITFQVGSKKEKYDELRVEIEIPLNRSFEAMDKIVELYKENKLVELYSYLSEIDFETRILSYEKGQLLFYLIDKENHLRGKPFFLRFAVFS